jgi:hypothetical protein
MGASCNEEWFTQRSSQTTALIISVHHGCAVCTILTNLCSEVVFGLFWISGFLTLGVTSARQCVLCITALKLQASSSTADRKQSYLFPPSRTTRLNMNDECSYVGVPPTTQDAMAEEDHDHPVQSSATHTLEAGSEAPAAPKLSATMVVGPFMLSIARNLTSCT